MDENESKKLDVFKNEQVLNLLNNEESHKQENVISKLMLITFN